MVPVTHGIEASIYLADRVVVMACPSGTVRRIVPVTLPRPRDPRSAGFDAPGRAVTALEMEQQARHQADEAHAAAGRGADRLSPAGTAGLRGGVDGE